MKREDIKISLVEKGYYWCLRDISETEQLENIDLIEAFLKKYSEQPQVVTSILELIHPKVQLKIQDEVLSTAIKKEPALVAHLSVEHPKYASFWIKALKQITSNNCRIFNEIPENIAKLFEKKDFAKEVINSNPGVIYYKDLPIHNDIECWKLAISLSEDSKRKLEPILPSDMSYELRMGFSEKSQTTSPRNYKPELFGSTEEKNNSSIHQKEEASVLEIKKQDDSPVSPRISYLS